MQIKLRSILMLPTATSSYRQLFARSNSSKSYKCLIVGGGTGGAAMAHKMTRLLGAGQVAVVEPSETHFYQPMFTLVGSGHKQFSQTKQATALTLPEKATWIKDSISTIHPEKNEVTTAAGLEIKYDYLIVALGIQLDYGKIPGLVEALQNDPMVVSNYSPAYVTKTFKAFQEFTEGTAIFTFPATPVKCAGAPQKIMYLFDDYLRRVGKRNAAKIFYNTNQPTIFGVKKYADALTRITRKRDLAVNFKHNLIEVRHETREAVFSLVGAEVPRTIAFQYDFLHVSPPMSAPKCIRSSPGMGDATGFLDVNKDTLQHNKFKNVFGIGDCTNLPTSKTAAAVAAQSGVLESTIKCVLAGKQAGAVKYDGYTSCPLITRQGKTILAEFDYKCQPLETFPVDQGKERTSMWYLKKDVMPFIYWNMLVKGRWHGPAAFRRLFRFGRGG